MERFLTLFITSLCIAPLFFFVFAGVFFSMHKGSGEGSLGVAYFGTWFGFLISFFGFFLVWWLAQRFVTGTYLRYLQIFDGAALIGWVVVYLIWSEDQPKTLNYPDHRPELDVEVRFTKSYLNGAAIDSLVEFQYIGQDFESLQPMHVREEGNWMILPWGTTPLEVNKWQLRVFVRNYTVDFQLKLPKRPQESTAWSDWVKPAAEQQQEPLPDILTQSMALRYRFRLVPHGSL
ncbi:hypothetical protein ACO2Q8_11650 [Larkinella sp. VNQ87]|uniref:hypothetical protein n=1 Tax=Larkinella sp. VNQ87 TaxID=3400921 RepID=UPI003C090018